MYEALISSFKWAPKTTYVLFIQAILVTVAGCEKKSRTYNIAKYKAK